MPDLFDFSLQNQLSRESPLAARIRPRSFDEFVGQIHIIGKGKLLRRAIETDRLFSSIILWGPPGSGKTTLAQIIANTTKSHFQSLSAVLAGIPELRTAIKDALERRRLYQQRTILFVDEVHRWNKAQQDALLPHVENGIFTFIGATTENPYFEVIGALVSRSRIFQLLPLTQAELVTIIENAVLDAERGLGKKKIELDPEARKHLIENANFDARNALNALELAVESTAPDDTGTIRITLEIAQDCVQRRALLYDKDGDAHYDSISAFIKSVRGSDPDAALYWLAKMIYAGEDPKFILRRLVILASEDVGLADPQGLVIATAAFNAFNLIGLPEGIYPMVEATLYLATAPKSNSAGAYFKAYDLIENEGSGEVPDHLKDPARDTAALGHGSGYQYPHNSESHFLPQQYLPSLHLGKQFYKGSDQGYEKEIGKRMQLWREAQNKVLGITNTELLPDLDQGLIEKIKRKTK